MSANALKTEIGTFFRFAPRILLTVSILYMLVDLSWVSIVFFLGIVAAELSTALLKKLSPRNWEWTNRPKEATSCGTVHTGLPSASKGTFSGHSAVAAFSATFWILIVLGRSSSSGEGGGGVSSRQILQSSALASVALAIFASRLLFKCHKKIQVLLGCGLGVGLGFLGHRVARKLEEKGPAVLKGACSTSCPSSSSSSSS